jgi:hypothetical protein
LETALIYKNFPTAAYLKLKGPKTLSNRMDISTAIVGKPGNKYSQGIIKAFSK